MMEEDNSEVVLFHCKCGWTGHDSECSTKHFGAYCGPDDNYDAWGWEEWDDLACPKCGKAVKEFPRHETHL